MRDTTSAAEQVRLDAIRRLEPVQRLMQALELSELARALGLRRLRELHADRTELELMTLLTDAQSAPPRAAGPAA